LKLPPIARQHTGDPVADRTQDSIARVIASLRSLPFADGVKAGPFTFGGAGVQLRVVHGLGRAPVGFLVIDATGTSHALPFVVSRDANAMVLKSTAAGTVTLWVY